MPDAYTTALKFGWVGNSPYTTQTELRGATDLDRSTMVYVVSSKMHSSEICITAVFIIIIIIIIIIISADSEIDTDW
jgi:hypothetical protein